MLPISFILITILAGLKFLGPTKNESKSLLMSNASFKKYYGLSYLLWLICGAALGAFIYFVLLPIGVKQDHKFDLYPDQAFWIGASVISGVAVGTIGMFGSIKIILRNQASDFWSHYDKMYNGSATLLLKILTTFLTIVGILLIFFGKQAEFKVYDEKIEVSRLMDLSSKEYNMSEIDAINLVQTFIAPNGDRVEKPHYEIVFNDGFRWNTRMDIREPKESDREVFEEISTASGKEISIVP